MTKKLICLLLAAFLGVSLVALLAACRGDTDAQNPPAQSTSLSTEESADASSDPSVPETTDVFSPEAATEHVEE